MDCSPPGSSVHEISQARILECVIFVLIVVSSVNNFIAYGLCDARAFLNKSMSCSFVKVFKCFTILSFEISIGYSAILSGLLLLSNGPHGKISSLFMSPLQLTAVVVDKCVSCQKNVSPLRSSGRWDTVTANKAFLLEGAHAHL